MTERSGLESEVQRLTRAVEDLQHRLAHVETRLGGSPAAPPSPAVASPGGLAAPAPPLPFQAPPTQVHAADVLAAVPLAGRLLLVMAGAYLIRAFTEGGQIPNTAGVALGFVYALVWIAAAWRAGAAGKTLSATFHGAVASMIVYPLLWETTTRFGYLSPPVSATLLGAVSLAALGVAARHGLRTLAWIFYVGAAACALLLLPRAGAAVPFTLLALVLGAGTLWIARAKAWLALPWVAALHADGAAFYLTTKALDAKVDVVDPLVALVLLLAFALAYLASFGLFSLKLRQQLSTFDVVQTAAVVLVGVHGSFRIAASEPVWTALLGTGALLGAVGYYMAAFALLHRERRRFFFYYSTVALALLLLGSAVLLPRPALPWTLLAVASAWLGSRFGRVTLSLHAALYVWAGAVASGLLDESLVAWVARATTAWPGLGIEAYAVMAGAIACAWLRIRGDTPYWKRFAVLPKLAMLLLIALGLGGVLLALLAPPIAGTPGHGASASVLATIRTAVLAALVLACALGRGSPRVGASTWLVFPLLGLGALKLLLEDLAHGQAATLWISLLCYGSVLIIAPRLAKARPPDEGKQGGGEAPG